MVNQCTSLRKIQMSLFAKRLLADVLEPAEARAHLTLIFSNISISSQWIKLQHVVWDLEQLRNSVPGVMTSFGASWWEHWL